MLKKLNTGRICESCGDFTKELVSCEVCHTKLCKKCAGNDYLCTEHYLKINKCILVNEYFDEKYKMQTSNVCILKHGMKT